MFQLDFNFSLFSVFISCGFLSPTNYGKTIRFLKVSEFYAGLWYALKWCPLVTLDLLIPLGAPQVTRVILVGHIMS
jgi:hypothetical protein